MKTLLFALGLGAATVLSTGCTDSHAASATATEPTPACNFKEGLGLELTPAGLAFIGLQTAEFSGRLRSPALLRTAKGDFVYVANGGRYLRTPVQVTARGLDEFEVTDGLYEGDTIVIAGVRALWLAELQAVNGGVGCADGH